MPVACFFYGNHKLMSFVKVYEHGMTKDFSVDGNPNNALR